MKAHNAERGSGHKAWDCALALLSWFSHCSCGKIMKTAAFQHKCSWLHNSLPWCYPGHHLPKDSPAELQK